MADDTITSIGIITQARMTSSRLPGKVLMEAGSKSMLEYHVARLQKTGYEVVIATTDNKQDDTLAAFASRLGIDCYRGSEDDVLSRFMVVQHAKKYDIIVRVTSDCPLIDPELIRQGINLYLEKENELMYVSNCFPRTFARGFDFEIFSGKMLEEANEYAHDIFEREHVTPYMWKNKPHHFHLENISQEVKNGSLRITIDTPEDFQLLKILIEEYEAEHLNYREIEHILISHPQLVAINEHIEQKKT